VLSEPLETNAGCFWLATWPKDSGFRLKYRNPNSVAEVVFNTSGACYSGDSCTESVVSMDASQLRGKGAIVTGAGSGMTAMERHSK
jgi:hypothetical protein